LWYAEYETAGNGMTRPASLREFGRSPDTSLQNTLTRRGVKACPRAISREIKYPFCPQKTGSARNAANRKINFPCLFFFFCFFSVFFSSGKEKEKKSHIPQEDAP